jgi:hypothetical protein
MPVIEIVKKILCVIISYYMEISVQKQLQKETWCKKGGKPVNLRIDCLSGFDLRIRIFTTQDRFQIPVF